jgi:hypothetical protein
MLNRRKNDTGAEVSLRRENLEAFYWNVCDSSDALQDIVLFYTLEEVLEITDRYNDGLLAAYDIYEGQRFPETLLPYSKEDIKNALKLRAIACWHDRGHVESIGGIYYQLAYFLPDDETGWYEKWVKTRNDFCSPNEELQKEAKATEDTMFAINSRVRENMSVLMDEWRDFLDEMSIEIERRRQYP